MVDYERGAIDDDAGSSELLNAANQNSAEDAFAGECNVHALERASLVRALHLVEVEAGRLRLNRVVVGEIVEVVASVQIELHLCKAVRLPVDHKRLVVKQLSRNLGKLILELGILERRGVQVEKVKERLVKVHAKKHADRSKSRFVSDETIVQVFLGVWEGHTPWDLCCKAVKARLEKSENQAKVREPAPAFFFPRRAGILSTRFSSPWRTVTRQ